MVAHNDITGDKLQTKSNTKEYRNNYDSIFGTPLYNIPNKTWVECADTGHRFFFDHPDGMYSHCKEVGGGISHYNMCMKVKISGDQSNA
jgi:hypothetical protein